MCGAVARRPGSASPVASTSPSWRRCCRAVTRPRGRSSAVSCSIGSPPTAGSCGPSPGSTRRSRHRSRCRCGGHSPATRDCSRPTTSPSPQRWRTSSGSGRRPASAPTAGRLHPDTDGLTMATFRQTTSRADDPQIHTHAVISAKVQTPDGRWLALDARYLKRHQRMLGGLYQSVLRNELTHRFGVDWLPIVNGQAEIAGVPDELLDVFSKRTVGDRRRARRQGRRLPPPRRPRPITMGTRRADPRSLRRHPGPQVRQRCRRSDDTVAHRSRRASAGPPTSSTRASTAPPTRRRRRDEPTESSTSSRRCRSSARRGAEPTCCRRSATPNAPVSEAAGRRWAAIARTSHRPAARPTRRPRPAGPERAASVRRAVGVDRTDRSQPHVRARPRPGGSDHHLGDGRPGRPARAVARRSTGDGLDPLQADAAAAVAGTRPPRRSSSDRPEPARRACSTPPSTTSRVKAERLRCRTDGQGGADARTRHRDPGRHRRQAAPRMAAPRPAATPRLPAPGRRHADRRRSRDAVDTRPVRPRQPRRPQRMATRPRRRPTPTAGRRPRRAARRAVRQRPRRTTRDAPPLHPPLGSRRVAAAAIRTTHAPSTPTKRTAGSSPAPSTSTSTASPRRGSTTTSTDAAVALVASTNDHVDLINHAVQHARLAPRRHRPRLWRRAIAGGEHAHVGDVIATRRNDRRLVTTTGEPVRNRETWTVTDVHVDGVDHRVPPRRTRHRRAARRVRPRTRPARLRRHRTRLAIRHRRARRRPRLSPDDPTRPLRRRHPRHRRERHLRRHRER